MRVKIHREGNNIILILLFILLVFNGLAFLFIGYTIIPIIFAIISGILFLFVVNFFRSPRRHYTGDRSKTVISSVDGTVVAVGENDNGQCNVSSWRDIIAISAGNSFTLGLKSDGTIMSTDTDIK